MNGVTLMVVLCLPAPVPVPDPAALTRQLGSPRFAERQAAAAALERLGDRALPALRRARAARDPEVRSRAAALADVLERRRLIRPSLVALDFRDRPLEEVVRALADRSGMALRLDPAGDPARRITLEAPDPVPFWEALDRLGRAAGLQPNSGPGLPAIGLSAVGGIRLQPGPPLRFTCTDGPLQVWAISWHHQRDLALDPEPGAPAPPPAAEQFFLQVQVRAEPRLWIRQAGAVRRLVAVDDRGQSLVPEDGGGQDDGADDGFSQQSTLPLTISLRAPDRPMRTLRLLRGSVPVVVSARTPDPLVIPLAGAAGKTFRSGDVALTVHAINDDPNLSRAIIELSVRTVAGSDWPGPDRGAAPLALRPIALVPHALESQIDVVDARGRILPMFLDGATVEGSETRLTLALITDGGPAPALGLGATAQLRFYGLIEAATEATFAFTDIPLP